MPWARKRCGSHSTAFWPQAALGTRAAFKQVTGETLTSSLFMEGSLGWAVITLGWKQPWEDGFLINRKVTMSLSGRKRGRRQHHTETTILLPSLGANPGGKEAPDAFLVSLPPWQGGKARDPEGHAEGVQPPQGLLSFHLLFPPDISSQRTRIQPIPCWVPSAHKCPHTAGTQRVFTECLQRSKEENHSPRTYSKEATGSIL